MNEFEKLKEETEDLRRTVAGIRHDMNMLEAVVKRDKADRLMHATSDYRLSWEEVKGLFMRVEKLEQYADRHWRAAAVGRLPGHGPEKPPLGLEPRHVHDARRKHELVSAIGRYEAAGLHVPDEWYKELNDLSGATL